MDSLLIENVNSMLERLRDNIYKIDNIHDPVRRQYVFLAESLDAFRTHYIAALDLKEKLDNFKDSSETPVYVYSNRP
jgi:hypothetical protein